MRDSQAFAAGRKGGDLSVESTTIPGFGYFRIKRFFAIYYEVIPIHRPGCGFLPLFFDDFRGFGDFPFFAEQQFSRRFFVRFFERIPGGLRVGR